MAVQAQYPTNALIHHRSLQEDRNQIGKDYSLQPQIGAIDSRFLDHQSPNDIFLDSFPGIVDQSDPRKRGREAGLNQHQLTDITRLHSGVNTGLRLAFSDQQRQSSIGLYPMSKDFSTQINQQRDEIEHFLQIQGEEIRRTLAEKRQKHYLALLEAAEASVSRRLKDKDAEAEKAVWRRAELEARAAQLSMEAQVWQARARAHEAEAASLQAQLQQALVIGGGGGGGRYCISQIEDAPPGCAAGDTEDAKSAYIDPERVVVASGPGCKACGKRVASVVLLPCRHLCVCSECDGVVLACPLCLSLRSSSIEVYMS
ncbi:BOI-related E3 ubiquitin-protein ligase 1-like isoform X2 [Cynara cardunculus var. scolymus]|uniref:BOI-related E3 ubiquitin-protein ligase 1-like isoform X2 n=1 Tax=Cynara cardunculus var. scolymus TaxID=59895 RepID=UPI000D62645D|nr:BOI-related E3 ubiquitin-protein ligase 1-like isoform X2 [Cynara cardunculus var. scolymus]